MSFRLSAAIVCFIEPSNKQQWQGCYLSELIFYGGEMQQPSGAKH